MCIPCLSTYVADTCTEVDTWLYCSVYVMLVSQISLLQNQHRIIIYDGITVLATFHQNKILMKALNLCSRTGWYSSKKLFLLTLLSALNSRLICQLYVQIFSDFVNRDIAIIVNNEAIMHSCQYFMFVHLLSLSAWSYICTEWTPLFWISHTMTTVGVSPDN